MNVAFFFEQIFAATTYKTVAVGPLTSYLKRNLPSKTSKTFEALWKKIDEITRDVPQRTTQYGHHIVCRPMDTTLFVDLWTLHCLQTYGHHIVYRPMDTALFVNLWTLHYLSTYGHHTVCRPMDTTLFANLWTPHYLQTYGHYIVYKPMDSTLFADLWTPHCM